MHASLYPQSRLQVCKGWNYGANPLMAPSVQLVRWKKIEDAAHQAEASGRPLQIVLEKSVWKLREHGESQFRRRSVGLYSWRLSHDRPSLFLRRFQGIEKDQQRIRGIIYNHLYRCGMSTPHWEDLMDWSPPVSGCPTLGTLIYHDISIQKDDVLLRCYGTWREDMRTTWGGWYLLHQFGSLAPLEQWICRCAWKSIWFTYFWLTFDMNFEKVRYIVFRCFHIDIVCSNPL